jgi:hypothetical protein
MSDRYIPTQLMNLTAVLPRSTLTNRKQQSLPHNYVPTDVDVCCGRGKRNWNHVGNISFRKLIQDNVERYVDAPTKNEKTAVVISLVDEIRANGGHFLKQNVAGSWFDIGDHQAREKVGHSLRDQVTSGISRNKRDAAMQQQHDDADADAVHHDHPPSVVKIVKKARLGSFLVDNSDNHSDSGRDREVRRATLSSSMIVDAFQRRPSFVSLSIAEDSVKDSFLNNIVADNIADVDPGVAHSFNSRDPNFTHSFNSHGSVRTSLKFLEGLDLEELFNVNMLVEPVTAQEAV